MRWRVTQTRFIGSAFQFDTGWGSAWRIARVPYRCCRYTGGGRRKCAQAHERNAGNGGVAKGRAGRCHRQARAAQKTRTGAAGLIMPLSNVRIISIIPPCVTLLGKPIMSQLRKGIAAPSCCNAYQYNARARGRRPRSGNPAQVCYNIEFNVQRYA